MLLIICTITKIRVRSAIVYKIREKGSQPIIAFIP